MPESIIAPELLELISAVASMISSTVSSAVAIFTYIAIAIGLFRMGKACGMKHTWLAFIPYAQSYRIGQIADHQCEVNEGKSTTYRRKLLTFHILLMVIAELCAIVTVGIYTVSIITKSLDGSLLTLMEDPMFIYQELLAAYADAWLVWLAFSVISIINTVVLRVPLAYVLAYYTKSAEFPNGHPYALSISLLVSWVLGMIFSAVAFRWGKTRKMIRREMANQAQLEA